MNTHESSGHEPHDAATGPTTYWAAHDPDRLFAGAAKVVCPFPRAVGRKHRTSDEVRPALDGPVHLSLVDPRDLWSSQGWVLRQHVDYYTTGEWERSGRTSADQGKASNLYPVVVIDHLGRQVIKAGHHRATAALLEGRPLLARVFPSKPDAAVAVLPHLLLGRSSRIPHVRCRYVNDVVDVIRGGQVALISEPGLATVAVLSLAPDLPAHRLPEGPPRPLDPMASRAIAWATGQRPVDVTGGFQLCTTCSGLRACPCPIRGYCEDHCGCEGIIPPPDESSDARERSLRCHLCQICGLEVVQGHSKYRFVICQRCRPQAHEFNRSVGRKVILQGIHSLVNGGPLLKGDPDGHREAEIVGFTHDLNTMFSGITAFGDWSDAMLVDRLRRLGFESDRVIPLEDYLGACTAAGITRADGWQSLRAHLLRDR